LASEKISAYENSKLSEAKFLLGKVSGKLEALNPLAVISRGYSAVYSQDKKLIKSVDQLSVGMKINFKTSDGSAEATVDNVIKDDLN